MSNEFSIESVVANATGLTKSADFDAPLKAVEGYDGFQDGVYAEFTQAQENLHFLDTFELINKKNASDKINMIKKIGATYNRRTIGNPVAANSLEAFCMENIQSLEEEAGTETKDLTVSNDGKGNLPTATKNDEKKAGFFKTVWEAIKRMFKAIAGLFVRIAKAVRDFVRRIMNKDMVVNNEVQLSDEVLINGQAIDLSSKLNKNQAVKIFSSFNDVAKTTNIADISKKVEAIRGLKVEEDATIINNVFGMKTCSKEEFVKKVNVGSVKDTLKSIDELSPVFMSFEKQYDGFIKGIDKYVMGTDKSADEKQKILAEIRYVAKTFSNITSVLNKISRMAFNSVKPAPTSTPKKDGEDKKPAEGDKKPEEPKSNEKAA